MESHTHRSLLWFKVRENFEDFDGSEETLGTPIHVKFTLQLYHRNTYEFPDGTSEISDETPDPYPTVFWWILSGSFIKPGESISCELSEMLFHLGVDREYHQELYDQLVNQVIPFLEDVPPTPTLVFSAKITMIDEHFYIVHENDEDGDSVGRALLESRRAFDELQEGGDCGMVPSSVSAVKTLLKNVNNSGEQEPRICTICLDELSSETGGLKMPCSHVFHHQCIVQWLSQSHYCPVCRFEMPID